MSPHDGEGEDGRGARGTDGRSPTRKERTVQSYRAEVQHILRTVYPSLQQKHVNVSQLRHEFAEDPFKEIEDKHRAILEIAVSKDKAPYHKRYHIERLIDVWL